MYGTGTKSAKTRQTIEEELLEELNRSQREWIAASEPDRAAARQRFMDALHTFNSLVLYGKTPEKP
jgi:hypothetical protein